MKIIKTFPSAPDYVFGSDEYGKTILAWMEKVPGYDDAVHFREISESEEIFDYRCYGYELPQTADEYEDIMAVAGPYEIEFLE